MLKLRLVFFLLLPMTLSYGQSIFQSLDVQLQPRFMGIVNTPTTFSTETWKTSLSLTGQTAFRFSPVYGLRVGLGFYLFSTEASIRYTSMVDVDGDGIREEVQDGLIRSNQYRGLGIPLTNEFHFSESRTVPYLLIGLEALIWMRTEEKLEEIYQGGGFGNYENQNSGFHPIHMMVTAGLGWDFPLSDLFHFKLEPMFGYSITRLKNSGSPLVIFNQRNNYDDRFINFGLSVSASFHFN